MSTALATPAPPAPAPTVAGEERFLIPYLSWDGYESLLREVGDGNLRISYLRGRVELMSPGRMHERSTKCLGRMVEALTEELDLPLASLRSTTLRRRDLERGVEADESYYVANAARLDVTATELDLNASPPPDLVIEVEITSALIDKLDIYAGLGVPEVWRHAGGRLIVLLLDADGRYAESPASRAFPFLPMEDFQRHLDAYRVDQETQWIKAFRAWVREVVAPLYQP